MIWHGLQCAMTSGSHSIIWMISWCLIQQVHKRQTSPIHWNLPSLWFSRCPQRSWRVYPLASHLKTDTIFSEVRLPGISYFGYNSCWMSGCPCKCQLQSLLCYLNHAATLVIPGRMFTHNLIASIRSSQHFHRLNSQCHADLLWWHEFSNP